MMEENIFDIKRYDFNLPSSLIAQEPLPLPSECRLLIVDRKKKLFEETVFNKIVDFLKEEDVLVLNNTKVIPAKLFARKQTGAKIEILLVKKLDDYRWEALLRPAKRLKFNDTLIFEDEKLTAKIVGMTKYGGRVLEFSCPDIIQFLKKLGKPPLPHYIKKDIDDLEKYQTVYAKKEGAIAAPTAGFHFTEDLLKKIKDKGVKIVEITLHCGISTFRPIKAADIREHSLEPEWIEVSFQAAKIINEAKLKSKKIIAVGTTSVRTLEGAVSIKEGRPTIQAFSGFINLYITEGFEFKIVDSLITNFHTPRSTNLVLVSAFCGYKLLMEAYSYAIKKNFRFYSFGDAMYII